MKQVWEETMQKLEKVYYRREAENISYLLLEDVFSISKSDILMQSEKSIDEAKLQGCIQRLLKYEPLQYITGFTYFYGRKFSIKQGALIPRPETEELVQLIIDENEVEAPRICDVGVGSGCITVSLALELQGVVFGTDISEDALAIASKNAANHYAAISFLNHDIIANDLPVKELDILVSNPPYIPNKERSVMNKNVLEFEPEKALFVPDDDPILFYRRIADSGIKALKTEGKLYFEIHENFGRDVKSYLEEIGYASVRIEKDMQGKDRMVSALKS